jgi:hypothetical protein
MTRFTLLRKHLANEREGLALSGVYRADDEEVEIDVVSEEEREWTDLVKGYLLLIQSILGHGLSSTFIAQVGQATHASVRSHQRLTSFCSFRAEKRALPGSPSQGLAAGLDHQR